MAAPRQPSSSERVKNFLWFSGIAILIALAILLWIRKSRSPAPSILERSAEVAEEQRTARLLAETRAAAQLAQGNDEAQRREAIRRLQQLSEENPDFVPAQEALVQVALMLKENAVADRTARNMVRRFPDAPAAHLLVGLVEMAAQRWPDAAAELTKAIELNKAHGGEPQWNLHGLLAETYLKQNKIPEADAQLREAANINLPATAAQIARSSLDLSERLGLVLLVGGKPDEAIPAYRLLSGVATHRKEDANAQYCAAAAALHAGRADEARTFLAAAEKLKPGDPRFAKLGAEIARAPSTRRAASGPATQPTTTATAPAP